MNEVVAVLCSDWHMCHNPPVARLAEKDWYAAMLRPIREVHELAEKHGCPMLIAGDLFDRWNSPPELVNWIIRTLGQWKVERHAVPGNHDLPPGGYRDVGKSSYWTLVEAGIINNVPPGTPTEIDRMILHGFPHGIEAEPCKRPFAMLLDVALVHRFVWTKATNVPGASADGNVRRFAKLLKGYDACLCGDNHRGFLSVKHGLPILNAGGLIRRRSDEKDYAPMVGLLHCDGTVEKHFLNCSEDKFADAMDVAETPQSKLDLDGFFEAADGLGEQDLDYVAAVERRLEKVKASAGVREETRTAMGGRK